ncbi:MAG: hypothetical protein IJV77_00615 [Clostridia bacterium]|nr:hypothetical protein [Clostridia bacterium]
MKSVQTQFWFEQQCIANQSYVCSPSVFSLRSNLPSLPEGGFLLLLNQKNKGRENPSFNTKNV